MKSMKKFWMTVMAAAVTFAVAACGETAATAENGLSQEEEEIVKIWAEGLASRDGKGRYDHMSKACKETFEEEQRFLLGDDWNYVIGFSSPWVVSFETEGSGDEAVITYTLEDNSQRYTLREHLIFGEENGETVVMQYYYDDMDGEENYE